METSLALQLYYRQEPMLLGYPGPVATYARWPSRTILASFIAPSLPSLDNKLYHHPWWAEPKRNLRWNQVPPPICHATWAKALKLPVLFPRLENGQTQHTSGKFVCDLLRQHGTWHIREVWCTMSYFWQLVPRSRNGTGWRRALGDSSFPS